MKVDSAQLNDLGHYLVVAENDAGKDQTECNVAIQQSPNIDNTPIVNPEAFRYLDRPLAQVVPDSDIDDAERVQPPKVIIPLSNIQLKEGETVLLIAKIDGYPKPKVIRIPLFLFYYN